MCQPQNKDQVRVQTIQSLVDMHNRVKRIRESSTKVPDEYFDRLNSLEELLSTNSNLLNKAHEFSVELEFILENDCNSDNAPTTLGQTIIPGAG